MKYKNHTLRFKQAVYEICSLGDDGVPRVVEDTTNIYEMPSGFFSYDENGNLFNGGRLYDTIDELKVDIELSA